MRKIENLLFKINSKNLIQLAFLWFLIGFQIGTLVLLYPVHWITDFSASHQWSKSLEDSLIKFVIVLLAIFTFWLAVKTMRAILKTESASKTRKIFIGLTVVSVFFMWMWFNPDLMNSTSSQKTSSESTANAVFYFGNYPSEAKLRELKSDGFTLVISLLNSAVVPFEPKLIKDEEKSVANVGIKYLHLPMLPWITDNQDAIAKIKDVIKNEKGKIYVHCYLGKDRVNVIKNIVKNNSGVIEATKSNDENRKLDKVSKLERGKIVKLEPDVYLTPYPTDEEYLGYILSSPIKHVVSLLNPQNKDDAGLIEKESKLLPQHQIEFHLLSVVTEPYNADSALSVVDKIRKIAKPVVIHGFFSNGPASEAIELSYKTGKQALPPSLFTTGLKSGAVSVISSNVVAGNEPSDSELKAYLYIKGIRKIAFTGSSNANGLKAKALKAGLDWFNFKLSDQALVDALRKDGTWYIFGSPTEEVKKVLVEKLK